MSAHDQDSNWRPLLTGALRERAGQAIQAIADRLREVPADWIPDGTPEPYRKGAANDPSIARGRAGLAIFYAYLAQAWSRTGHQEEALRLLDEAVDLLAVAETRPSLFAGFTGVAWTAQHFRGTLIDPAPCSQNTAPEADDPNDEIDNVLRDYLDRSPWPGEYDVVYGLVGFGVYALERLPRASAIECLERVIDRLGETAERCDDGVTWLTPPELLPPHQRAQAPRGLYNAGVAHGVPGVIALLGEVCAAGVASEKARPLLDGAVRWLLAQKLPSDMKSSFPYWVGPDIKPGASRSAWCYGDPGIAAALLVAARCVGEPAWEREAIDIARHAARRAPEKTGIVDAGLCHGAAGLGHLFNRMYQATGEPELEEAARFWFDRTLELRRPDRDIAGFSAWMAAANGEGEWVADPYFLTGAAGVGLALLAATTSVEPAWDRVLLVDVCCHRRDAGGTISRIVS
ncbi:MAG: lanthionine synthetase C family protein [Phycisphaerae bacterium]|nr:lanthionine synthetase C family protein [Phycisphaerae bacterium]